MRRGRPSVTASLVAFGRGVGLCERRRDGVARGLLAGPAGLALAAFDRTGWSRGLVRHAVRAVTLGLVDHVALRTAAIDSAIAAAVHAGTRQLVILGAGLDARAYRMDELEAVTVIEVDHPETQRFKRDRAATRSLKSRCRQLIFAPVDFEKQRLGAVLDVVGHRSDRPTMWLWEGVTMYLTEAAIESTLLDVSRRSARDSALLLTYMTPSALGPGPLRKVVVSSAFRALGEPLLGVMTRSDVARRLAYHGFGVEHDTDSTSWASRWGGSALLASGFRSERLAVALRRDTVA